MKLDQKRESSSNCKKTSKIIFFKMLPFRTEIFTDKNIIEVLEYYL